MYSYAIQLDLQPKQGFFLKWLLTPQLPLYTALLFSQITWFLSVSHLLYKAEKPSVCPSIRPSAFFPHRAADSAVSMSIDFRLA